jgi:hydroxymethylglutaryl-CoA reductase (NADPH)
MLCRTQIVSFVTLHILNLCTTLTPAAAVARHNTLEDRPNTSYPEPTRARAVDVYSQPILDVLNQIAAVTDASPNEFLVKVHAPLHIRAAPAPTPARASPNLEDQGSLATSRAALDGFLESWTHLVGDPVMSKWIVCLLALSVGLNGLLLRGLGLSAASGAGAKGGVRFASQDGARSPLRQTAFESEPEPEVAPKVVEEKVKISEPMPVRPTHIDIPKPQPVRATAPLLDAVDAKLLESQAAEARALASQSAPSPTEPIRPMEELITLFNSTKPASIALAGMNDEEVIALAQGGKIAPYALEKVIGDLERAVKVRRALICKFICLSIGVV